MMRFSRLFTWATNVLGDISPERAAAWSGAALAFLLALALLGDTLHNAAAGTQMLATSLGGLIAAFLSSRLAAYLVRVVALWAGWPARSRSWQMTVALFLAVFSAALMLTVMVLLS